MKNKSMYVMDFNPRWTPNSVLSCVVLSGILFSSQSALAADEPASVLEEVVVYAQKRPERAQDVPVALTAMTGEMIRETGLLTIEGLTELSPSVSFDTAQSWQNSSLKIRGIGTVGNTRSFEGAVGVFIDDVYRSRSGMALSDLLDIDRLEILRGPQSTLFGRNTVAGTIALHSARPDAEALGGYVDLRMGDKDFSYVAGALNLPMGDSAAWRLSGVNNKRDGFFQSPDTGDQYDQVDRYGLKAQFLLSPGDDWELHIIADAAKSDAACCWGSAQVVNGPTSPLIDAYSSLNGYAFIPAPAAERDRAHTLNAVPRELIEEQGISARTQWSINENWSAKTVTSFRNWEHSQLNADADFVPADLFILNEPADIDSFSQEFNINYSGDRFDILFGASYFSEKYLSVRSAETGSDADNYLNALISAGFGSVACLPPIVSADCLFPVGIGALLPDGEFTRERYQEDSSGYAFFGHATTALSDTFSLVTGIRYDAIEKDGGIDNLFWYDSAIARASLPPGVCPDNIFERNGLDLIGTCNSPSFRDATKNTEVTGTLQLQYQLGESGMIYGGYHRGFKAGGVNLFREGVITNTTYAPEIADSIEAGIKIDYFGGRARTNLAIFNTEFSDLQINFFTGLEFRTENTGEASTRGMEIENFFQVNDQFRINLAATYLQAQFDRIDNPLLSYLVGRDTPRAPRLAAVGQARYVWELANDKRFFVRGKASYEGSHYVGADVASEPKAGSYVVTDTSLGISGPNDKWEAALWCSNCFDESYRTIYFNSTFQPGSYNAYLNDPRQYGFSFRMRF